MVLLSEAVAQKCSVKKVFSEFSQNSQENTCASVSVFNKVAALRPATLLKNRLWHRCFHVNFAKSLRTTFLKEYSDGCFYTHFLDESLLLGHIKYLIEFAVRNKPLLPSRFDPII